MKKVVVFGATGGTGQQVVEQALQAGYQVTVVVRNPATLLRQHPCLEIRQGDVFQPLGYAQVLSGASAVVSCLGSQQREPTTVYSEGVNNIVQAMRDAGVSRIICLSSIAVGVPPRSSWLTKLVTKYILQRLFNHLYADMLRMEDLLRKSALTWTVIRPPRLVDAALRGTYRTAINEPIHNPSKIARADLAHYIVNHLADEKTFKAKVEISY